MKNNRAKIAAFKWKHYRAHRTTKKFERNYKPCKKKRFAIRHYAKTVHLLISQSDNGIGFPVRRGERCGCFTKGVHFQFGTMTFTICGTGDGVTSGKNRIL